jgi:hypothetical protein
MSLAPGRVTSRCPCPLTGVPSVHGDSYYGQAKRVPPLPYPRAGRTHGEERPCPPSEASESCGVAQGIGVVVWTVG